jgi:hypothetical protein
MVKDSENFPDEVEQAKYYEAICDNKINKTASFDDSKDEIFEFQTYNSDSIDSANTYKYANYLNIATIYVDKLASNPELADRTISLLEEASENLNDNATVLSKEFPDERGVNYYSGKYSAVEFSVYTYLAEESEDPKDKVSYYQNAINSIDGCLACLDISGSDVSEATKNSYAEYSRNKAETYVEMAKYSGSSQYYDEAEDVYENAENILGNDDYAADLYTSNLTYLYDRYTEELGGVPDNWSRQVTQKIISVYSKGSKVSLLADGKKPQWNTLIRSSVIDKIISDTDLEGN